MQSEVIMGQLSRDEHHEEKRDAHSLFAGTQGSNTTIFKFELYQGAPQSKSPQNLHQLLDILF